MNAQEYLSIHVSSEKAQIIATYISNSNCSLKITKPRKTKRGDFRTKGNNHSISVNHDTNSFRFLFTLVHEIAHLKTHLDFGQQIKPHGKEWKNNFKLLFQLFNMKEDFEKNREIYHAVLHELEHPKACSGVNVGLEKAFSLGDKEDQILLDELPLGSHFIFRNHRYQKMEDRRTRVMCLNLSNNRKYTINKAAPVREC
jgi:SprT protein